MSPFTDAWLAHQRKRWLRPDAHRWLRHDAHRFLPPALKFERRAVDAPSVLQLFLESKAGYNPDQLRVPKHNPGGGQWTRVASLSGRGGRNRFGGNFPGATYGQLVRLDRAIARTEDALAQIRRFDPNWRLTTPNLGAPGSVEAAIRHAEARAEQAIARLDQLRSGIGGNFGPPLEPLSPHYRTDIPLSRTFDGPTWIGAYRTINNMPDLFGRPTWQHDKGTVAVTEIDGSLIFGVNSSAPGYSNADQAEAEKWRQTLLRKYPGVMNTRNVGGVPNNSLYHAETTILLRAAREIDGGLAGRNISIHVDRSACWSCKEVLPLLALELGNPTITYVEISTGKTSVLHNGSWLSGIR